MPPHQVPRNVTTSAAAPLAPLAPSGDCDVAGVAALVGEPARAAMLLALLDGRALPAGELARTARVAPATASAHLARLVAGGLLSVSPRGRHRYYRLAHAGVARALEALALVAPARPARTARDGHVARQLRVARTCYDHLAGWLGVRVAEALVAREALVVADHEFAPGPRAAECFAVLGVDVAAVAERARAGRRPLARACLDWSERQPHLAGALGAALVDAWLARGWIARMPAGRALQVTEAGRRALREHLGVRVADALAPVAHAG